MKKIWARVLILAFLTSSLFVVLATAQTTFCPSPSTAVPLSEWSFRVSVVEEGKSAEGVLYYQNNAYITIYEEFVTMYALVVCINFPQATLPTNGEIGTGWPISSQLHARMDGAPVVITVESQPWGLSHDVVIIHIKYGNKVYAGGLNLTACPYTKEPFFAFLADQSTFRQMLSEEIKHVPEEFIGTVVKSFGLSTALHAPTLPTDTSFGALAAFEAGFTPVLVSPFAGELILMAQAEDARDCAYAVALADICLLSPGASALVAAVNATILCY